MSTYYGIRCKCVVKKEYRELVGKLLGGENFLDCEQVNQDARLNKIQNIHRIECLFKVPSYADGKDFDEDVIFSNQYNAITGAWHICRHINHAEDVYWVFVKIIVPIMIQEVRFLQMQVEDVFSEGGVVYTTNMEQVHKDPSRFKLFSPFQYQITVEGVKEMLMEF